jgi:hypothetical protein
MARCFLARTLLLQGLADQVRWHARVAFQEVQAAGQSSSLAAGASTTEVAIPIEIMTGDLDTAAHSIATLIGLSNKRIVTFWADCGPCLQAVLLIRRGEFVEGATRLSNALEAFRSTGNTELLRTKGERLLRDTTVHPGTTAENCFLEAIETARQQGTLLWEPARRSEPRASACDSESSGSSAANSCADIW